MVLMVMTILMMRMMMKTMMMVMMLMMKKKKTMTKMMITMMKAVMITMITMMICPYRIKSQECGGSDQSVLGSKVIDLEDMLGVFVLVYGGMGIAFLTLVGEFIYACAQDVTRCPDKPRTVREAAAMRLESMVRPLVTLLHPRRTRSNSTNASNMSNYADCEEGFQLQFLQNTPDAPSAQTAY
uniref:Uncharacterized protein n=1 Tax=Branchiostoma floridae TaxID=7739 RepID=C3ZKA9_BRAFL|eukprot:XP_002590997.1 hypothetical protein BRAFLDRAFT_69452 [Branchiostoma floridae]